MGFSDKAVNLCKFNATLYRDANSYTIAVDDIDLAENAKTKEAAITKLAEALLDYASEYYNEFDLYSNAPNRKAHLSFVKKALFLNDVSKIKKEIICRNG